MKFRAYILILIPLLIITGGCSSPKYDGVYQSDQIDDYWNYLRFYPDGTVITVPSSAQPSNLAEWFTQDHPELSRGKFSLKGKYISFSSVCECGTVEFTGVIDGGQIDLHSYSHINGHQAQRVYKFIKCDIESARWPFD